AGKVRSRRPGRPCAHRGRGGHRLPSRSWGDRGGVPDAVPRGTRAERMTTRTLIVDDSELARRGIRVILTGSPLFDVVGEATTGHEGIDRVREIAPDLVLMDLRMPGLGGLEAIRLIKEEFPSTLVVVLSVSDDPQDLF